MIYQNDVCEKSLNKVHHADCLEFMRLLPDNCIDSIVTDPPYELGFMGKTWDNTGIANKLEVWQECLRILKPGGFLLAFSGSRTYHRMTCAIEDAGFEIRDQIMWIYGSGFPKSLNISKAIDKVAPRLGKFQQFSKHYAEKRAEKKLTHSDICEVGHFYNNHNHGGASTNWEKGNNVPTPEQWKILQPLLDLSLDFLPLIERIEAERAIIGTKKTNLTVYQNIGAGNISGEIDITAAATQDAKEWQGWGTALKPAHEPICVARKPFIGTVAENVLRHGTGGLNIDDCRIDYENAKDLEDATWGRGTDILGGNYVGGLHSSGKINIQANPSGRWPANIIHDGSEEVLNAFPDANGQSGDLNETGRPRTSLGIYGNMAAPRMYKARAESNKSAARFFYCAKTSKQDRDEGLEDFELKEAGIKNDSGRGFSETDPHKKIMRANIHPTVKPTDLMRYLCRLVTPPGGIIFDPFTGSGSTGKAAVLEGFKFLGSDITKEYVEIASARLAHAFELFEKENQQPDLF